MATQNGSKSRISQKPRSPFFSESSCQPCTGEVLKGFQHFLLHRPLRLAPRQRMHRVRHLGDDCFVMTILAALLLTLSILAPLRFAQPESVPTALQLLHSQQKLSKKSPIEICICIVPSSTLDWSPCFHPMGMKPDNHV